MYELVTNTLPAWSNRPKPAFSFWRLIECSDMQNHVLQCG